MKILIILEIILSLITLNACKTTQTDAEINTALSLSGSDTPRGPRMLRTEGAAFTKIITQSDRQIAAQFEAESGDVILGNELIQVKIKGIDEKDEAKPWAPLVDSLRIKKRSGWSKPIDLKSVFRRNWPTSNASIRRVSLVPSTSEDRAFAYLDMTYAVILPGQSERQEFLRLIVPSKDTEIIVLTDDVSFVANRPFLKARTSIGLAANQVGGVEQIERFPKSDSALANHLLLRSDEATGCVLGSTPVTIHAQTSTESLHIVDAGGRSVGGMEYLSFNFDPQVCASANFVARARHQCLSKPFSKSTATNWFNDWDILDQCVKATPYATLFVSRPREAFARVLALDQGTTALNTIIMPNELQNIAIKLVPDTAITITDSRLGQVWFPQPGLKLGPQQSEQLNLPAGLSPKP